MIASLNFNELKHVITWFKAINGDNSTLGELKNYITTNKIKNKIRLLNKLNADFVALP